MKPTSTAPELRVVYYALGGGRGHATRSRTLAGWLPAQWDVHFLLPQRLRAWGQGLQAHFVEENGLAAAVRDLLRELSPDLLLVDTFPRGVLGELAEIDFGCPAWLVGRWLKLAYAARPEVQAAVRRYQQVLNCELTPWEGLDIGPVVAPAGQAGEGCEMLWLGSGPVAEQRRLQPLLQAVTAAPDLGLGRADVGTLLAGAELVISAGGYNAYHEIVQSGTPAIFWPQDRLYDEQPLRVQGKLGPGCRAWHRCVHDEGGLEEALQEWRKLRPPPAGPVSLSRPELLHRLFTDSAALKSSHS